MQEPGILVTGATGNVGAEVVRQLGAQGHAFRVGTRDGTWLGDAAVEAITPVRLDFMEPDTWPDALAGVRKVFLVRPPAISDVKTNINPFIDLAREVGTERIVLLSLLGAERIPVVPHRKIELHLERSGMDHTFLRASFFMQNLTTTHLAEIRDEGVIAVPAGRGKTSFVDVRDIASVATMALLDDRPGQMAYPLTGSEALDYGQVAAILTEVLGRRIQYTRPGLVSFARRMRRQGNPFGFIAVTSAIYTTARLGMAGTVTPDLERLLGRPPITMRQFVADHAGLWSHGETV